MPISLALAGSRTRATTEMARLPYHKHVITAICVVSAPVAGHRERGPGGGGGQLGRGAQPGPLDAGSPPAAGRWWGRGVQHGVPDANRVVERDRCGQVSTTRSPVGGIGDHMHPPVGERRGQQPDQLAGLGGLGRAPCRAGAAVTAASGTRCGR